ncbi:MAG: D-aminoacylase [Chloroflexota bacterium]|nr:D-aminoacylase [Chloroflexota bacterium]
MLDLIIRNGTVIDGSGAPGGRADVGVGGGHVLVVGDLSGVIGAREIDATGRCVSPGFIDIHTHSDRSTLVNPRMESKIRQGVTTEIGGLCGLSLAPLGTADTPAAARVAHDVAKIGMHRTWLTLADLYARVEQTGLACNYASFVGHGVIRAAVMGYDDRTPTEGERAGMQRLLRQSMADGALGLSTGLIYPPGIFAQPAEITELCGVLHETDGLYTSHIRNEGNMLHEAVDEFIAVCRDAGVRGEMSHHKADGRANWGKVQGSLQQLDDARTAGVDVMCDQYPYTAYATGLAMVLPPWALDGAHAATLRRLDDPAARDRIRADIASGLPGWENMARESGWENIVVTGAPHMPECAGKSLAAIADARGSDEVDATCALLIAHQMDVSIVGHSMDEGDVEAVMRWPLTSIGSDGSALAPYGPLSTGMPHPRSYGTFPRVLGRYVRERGTLKLEEAVHKMTGLPAARLNLSQRGLLRTGYWADIAIWDAATIADTATYTAPHHYPVGITTVIVNGTVVINERGEQSGTLPGRVLRHHERSGTVR